MDGTSVTTAYVSAAAAMMLSINGQLMPEEIIRYIVQGAHPTATLKGACVAGGYLDIDKTITLLKEE